MPETGDGEKAREGKKKNTGRKSPPRDKTETLERLLVILPGTACEVQVPRKKKFCLFFSLSGPPPLMQPFRETARRSGSHTRVGLWWWLGERARPP
jgi:hypothetical protein